MSLSSSTPTIPVPPDWSRSLRMQYEFNSVFFKNDRLNEQRRALFNTSRRSMQVNFILNNTDFEKLFFKLLDYKDKNIAVPIYSEVRVPSGYTNGATNAEITIPSTSDFWNWNNRATYCFVGDYSNNIADVHEIISLTDTLLTVNPLVDTDCTIGSMIVYPVFYGFIDSEPSITGHSSKVIETKISFREYIDG